MILPTSYSKAYIHCNAKLLALGPNAKICVGNTNMLVSKNANINITPNANSKICVTLNAKPRQESVEYRFGLGLKLKVPILAVYISFYFVSITFASGPVFKWNMG